jgi:hypothetical protein
MRRVGQVKEKKGGKNKVGDSTRFEIDGGAGEITNVTPADETRFGKPKTQVQSQVEGSL